MSSTRNALTPSYLNQSKHTLKLITDLLCHSLLGNPQDSKHYQYTKTAIEKFELFERQFKENKSIETIDSLIVALKTVRHRSDLSKKLGHAAAKAQLLQKLDTMITDLVHAVSENTYADELSNKQTVIDKMTKRAQENFKLLNRKTVEVSQLTKTIQSLKIEVSQLKTDLAGYKNQALAVKKTPVIKAPAKLLDVIEEEKYFSPQSSPQTKNSHTIIQKLVPLLFPIPTLQPKKHEEKPEKTSTGYSHR